MNDLRVLRMQIIERIQQLISPQQYLTLRKGPAPARYHLREIIAGYKLHDEKRAFTLGKVIANARQRRMMQTGEQTCFALELFAQSFLSKQCLFQRYRCIQSLIDGFINRAHPALPKLPT